MKILRLPDVLKKAMTQGGRPVKSIIPTFSPSFYIFSAFTRTPSFRVLKYPFFWEWTLDLRRQPENFWPRAQAVRAQLRVGNSSFR